MGTTVRGDGALSHTGRMNTGQANDANHTPLQLLAEASRDVGSTTKRGDKTTRLAELFALVAPSDVEIVVGLMLGRQRQGRIGIGWAAVSGLDLVPAEKPTLTVRQIDEMLTQLAATTGHGSTAARADILVSVLELASTVEMDFMRQVLVGEVRQGALAGVISDGVALAADVPKPLLRRATMLRGDLAATAAIALAQGAEGLGAVTLEVGRPVEPMLARTSDSVATAIESVGTSSVEWKLDGARIQVHRAGDQVSVHTRNLNDITDRLPQVVQIVRGFPVDRVVLDGEVLGLDADGAPLSFQDTASAVGQEQPEERHARGGAGLRPFFFDVMAVDDRVLIDDPLHERRRVLAEIVGEHGIPSIVTDDATEAGAHLEAAIAAGHEGVMVKGIDSRYEAGRRGSAWRKVKPVHTLDLVVLAAEWGHGRRQGWLSNLHLGALDPLTGEPVMVGKTFKGMTDDILRWQTDALLAREKRRSSTGHTVYVEPDLVVEVALDGAQRSTRYPGGVALRFARLRGYRTDKDPADADTLTAVRALLK
jgi:DNA ligase-1